MKTKLIFFLLFYIFRQKGASVISFLSFGGTGGVITRGIVASNDEVSESILISGGGIPHSNGYANEVIVSENGAISFNRSISSPPAVQGPTLYSDVEETLLLAPYWTDNNLAAGGRVRYEVYERDHTAQEQRFNLVGRFIANRTGSSEAFEGSWMILVEWLDCVPNIREEAINTIPSDQTNTFQAIVITDGTSESYAIFTYRCDLIQWSGSDPIYAKIGVNYGMGIELLHNLSGSEMANEIDCINNETGEWTNLIFNLNTMLASPVTLASGTASRDATTRQTTSTIGGEDNHVTSEADRMFGYSTPLPTQTHVPVSTEMSKSNSLILVTVIPAAVGVIFLAVGVTISVMIIIHFKKIKKNKIATTEKSKILNVKVSEPHFFLVQSVQGSYKWAAHRPSKLELGHMFKAKPRKIHAALIKTDSS